MKASRRYGRLNCGRRSARLLSIIFAHKFNQCLSAGITQTKFGQTNDPSVTTFTIAKSQRQFIKENINGFFAAERGKRPST